MIRLTMIAALAMSHATLTSEAAEITRSGSTIIVHGRVESGDDLKFRDVAPTGSYRAVNLTSIGGDLSVTATIARNIKSTAAITVYDANQGPCSSACTILFVAGTSRHYVNSANIVEGIGAQGKRGLGFHEARDYETGNGGRAAARMNALYYEMGSPAAADLSNKSPNRTVYYISGNTALSLGIATSLYRP